MKILGLFTLVYVMGGSAPSVDTVAHNFMALQDCKARAADWNEKVQDETYRNGKPILYVRAVCTAISADEVLEQAGSLK